MHKQTRALMSRPQIIIATPGRLCDHLKERGVNLSHVSTLVLDEADRMLDMGFAPQLNQILRHLPKKRQTLLFSATLAPEIEKLAVQMLHQPTRVSIGAVSRPVEKIQQSIVQLGAQPKAGGKPANKNDVLLDLINERPGSIIIFTRTKHRTDRVAKFLGQYNLPVARIHGDRTQGQRNRAMDGFRSGEFRILVATDIAARGLDISHIGHVINYDLPQVPEDYVHRIGRTARAGAEGEAVSILGPEDREMWGRIQKLIGGKAPALVAAASAPRSAPAGAKPAPARPNGHAQPGQQRRSRPRRWRH
jgi:ATP-dependent RNA helicase RhlE